MYYICDGSRKGTRMGAGIVQITKNKKNLKTFHFSGTFSGKPSRQHEEFAILKTLEVIESQPHLNGKINIYNDDISLYRALTEYRLHKDTPQKCIIQIVNKAKKLNRKGLSITFKHTDDLKEEDHQYEVLAHKASRIYLGEKFEHPSFTSGFETKADTSSSAVPVSSLKEVFQDTPVFSAEAVSMPEESKVRSFLGVPFVLNTKEYFENKQFLQQYYSADMLVRHEFLLSDKKIRKAEGFIFQKLSREYWAVLTTNQELVYVGDHFLSLAKKLLKKLKKVKKDQKVPLRLNAQFFNALEGTSNTLSEQRFADKEKALLFAKVLQLLHGFHLEAMPDVSLQQTPEKTRELA